MEGKGHGHHLLVIHGPPIVIAVKIDLNPEKQPVGTPGNVNEPVVLTRSSGLPVTHNKGEHAKRIGMGLVGLLIENRARGRAAQNREPDIELLVGYHIPACICADNRVARLIEGNGLVIDTICHLT